MVCMGILQNNMRTPFPECYTTFWRMTIYSDTLHWSDITPIFDTLLIWTLLPNLTFYLILLGFHGRFATDAACQKRTLTPPDTWSCPNLGLACVLMSRPISPELVLFPFLCRNIPSSPSSPSLMQFEVTRLQPEFWQKCTKHGQRNLIIIKFSSNLTENSENWYYIIIFSWTFKMPSGWRSFLALCFPFNLGNFPVDVPDINFPLLPFVRSCLSVLEIKKEEIWLSPMTKAPSPTEK